MRNGADEDREPALELAFELDEPPSKVWRAVTIPALRAMWLPEADLADSEAVTTIPDEEVRYRLRDATPPFLESTVIFRLAPNATGGTLLRILHRLDDARLKVLSRRAANANDPPRMRAA